MLGIYSLFLIFRIYLFLLWIECGIGPFVFIIKFVDILKIRSRVKILLRGIE